MRTIDLAPTMARLLKIDLPARRRPGDRRNIDGQVTVTATQLSAYQPPAPVRE
jgi:hypothetical protein